MLTDGQREELKALGAETVRTKLLLAGAGRGASVAGFKCGNIPRGDIEDWLQEKNRQQSQLQRSVLFWARVAGVAGLAAAVLGLAQLLVTK